MTDDDRSAFEYFQRIESHFLLLRGAPLLLSPSDYRVAKSWHGDGVPLDLVLRTMDEYFERRAERAHGDRAAGEEPAKVWGLRQIRPAVDAAWKHLRELTAPGDRNEPGEGAALDVAARLAALREALERVLPAELPERAAVLARLDALGGESDPRRVEEGLGAVAAAALDALLAEIPAGEREELAAGVERTLAPLADRMTREEVEATRERLLRQKVRQKFGLPTLSLFSEL
jgi:hypothetical protein